MTLAANVGGVFKSAKKYSVNVGGTWKDIKKAWVRDGGLWKPYYSPVSGPATMIASLTNLGLLTNLKVCLDASDIASFPNSTYTKWLDTSGNGEDFFRGTSTSSEATDPAFVGTAGTLVPPAYFTLRESSSTSDRFNYDSATNPSWINLLHQAGGKWSVGAWVRLQDTNNRTQAIFSTGGVFVADTGVFYYLNSGGESGGVLVSNGSSNPPPVNLNSTLVNPDTNVWAFFGCSVDLSVIDPKATFVINGVSETLPITFSATLSTGNASQSSVPISIGVSRRSTTYIVSNMDVAKVAVWDRVLSASNLISIYEAQRAMFGV